MQLTVCLQIRLVGIYLDAINIFLAVLQLLSGRRRDLPHEGCAN